jgi:hypothetical protein
MLATGYDDPIEAMGALAALARRRRTTAGMPATHPPQDQDVVVAAVRWPLSGVPGGGAQPGPRNR